MFILLDLIPWVVPCLELLGKEEEERGCLWAPITPCLVEGELDLKGARQILSPLVQGVFDFPQVPFPQVLDLTPLDPWIPSPVNALVEGEEGDMVVAVGVIPLGKNCLPCVFFSSCLPDISFL